MAFADTRSRQVSQVTKTILEYGVTFPNSGLHILDSNATHDLIITPGSNLTADRILTLTTGDSARTITLSGNPTLADWFDQAVKTTSDAVFASVTVGNSGLHVLDTNASHDLIITPGSNLTADRVLTITTGDSARTVTLSGDPTLSDWFDQDVKTTGTPQHARVGIGAAAHATNPVTVTTTDATASSKAVNIAHSGAITGTGYGIYSSKTGASTANVAGYFIATGGTANYAVVTGGGQSGFGVATPTAMVHIQAGTATASTAPLKLTSGTLLATPEAGAIEFLTDAFYATISTGPARKTIAFLESPAFTTPNIGVATATSVTIGANVLDTAEFANLDGINQTVATTSSPTFVGVTLNNTGLHLLDTNASHDLILAPGSNLTADRTCTITTGDSDRTITLSGNPTLGDSIVDTDYLVFYEGALVAYDEAAVYAA